MAVQIAALNLRGQRLLSAIRAMHNRLLYDLQVFSISAHRLQMKASKAGSFMPVMCRSKSQRRLNSFTQMESKRRTIFRQPLGHPCFLRFQSSDLLVHGSDQITRRKLPGALQLDRLRSAHSRVSRRSLCRPLRRLAGGSRLRRAKRIFICPTGKAYLKSLVQDPHLPLAPQYPIETCRQASTHKSAQAALIVRHSELSATTRKRQVYPR